MALLSSCVSKESTSANIEQQDTLDTVRVKDYEMTFYSPVDSCDSIVYLYSGVIERRSDKSEFPFGKGKAIVKVGRYPRAVYEGAFVNGLFEDDNGKIVFSNGASFEGTFITGTYVKGIYKEADGAYYEGFFTEDTPLQVKVYDKDGTFLGEAELVINVDSDKCESPVYDCVTAP